MANVSAARNLVVGLIFLGSLVVLGTATIWMRVVPFWNKVEALAVRFPDAGSLKPGDDVFVHGLRVGQVDRIQYDPDPHPDRPILVACTVPKAIHDRLGAGSQFAVQSAGPLGGRYLEITPPPVPGPPPELGYVGTNPGDLFKQLADLVRRNETNITNLFEKLGPAVERIDAAAAEVKETFRLANTGEGTLGLLLKDKGTKDRVEKGVGDLGELIAGLREDLSGEKGTIGYLLKNQQAKDDLRAAITDLTKIIKQVGEGSGIASRFINDKDLADRIGSIVDDVHDVVHKVSNGQGTLGQFVNNPKAWDEMVRILVLAHETIEDLREQAPVSTFVNAAFAAF